jgi:membrane-anchored glycerophosphoryl diester phosphodiesterase (GDPDase)
MHLPTQNLGELLKRKSLRVASLHRKHVIALAHQSVLVAWVSLQLVMTVHDAVSGRDFKRMAVRHIYPDIVQIVRLMRVRSAVYVLHLHAFVVVFWCTGIPYIALDNVVIPTF